MSLDISGAQAACIVADREHLEGLDHIVGTLGGGWLEAATLWKNQTRAPFLVLLANDTQRLARGAPLAMMAIDPEYLPEIIKHACSLLDNVRCAWVQLLEPSTMEIVQKILLAETVPGGCA